MHINKDGDFAAPQTGSKSKELNKGTHESDHKRMVPCPILIDFSVITTTWKNC